MKRISRPLWFLGAAALMVSSLPAHAGFSIDRASVSTAACAWAPAPSDVFRQPGVPAQGCDVNPAWGPVIDTWDANYGMGVNDDVDALATNEALPPTAAYYMLFSGDLASQGLPPSVYRNHFVNNQAAGDIFRTVAFPTNSPWAVMASGCAVVATVPFGPPNIFLNQELNNLIPSVGPGIFYAGVPDELDAFELDPLDTTGDQAQDRPFYFSIDPAGLYPAGPADILRARVGLPTVLWSPGGNLGLVAGDDVDALVVWDRGIVGAVNPGVDLVLFSLAPGSPSLGANSAADLFVSDLTGAFCLYMQANQLGLRIVDNVDALDVMP